MLGKEEDPPAEPNVLTVSKYEEYIPSSSNSDIKQKILEEQEYLSILAAIIEKDFFPELSKLKLRAAYLDSLETDDLEKLRDIQLQLDKFENGESHTEDLLNDKNISLNKFLTKNTSEDNASFEKLMEITRKKQREKYAWLFEKEEELKSASTLYLKNSSDSSDNNSVKALETWSYQSKNALMYVPNGVKLSAEEEISKKGKKVQVIEHKNTRFKENPFDSFASQMTLLKATKDHANQKKVIGKIGVDGKLEQVDEEMLQLRGYSFVGTPSPSPGVDSSPLMTWGQVEMTPKNIDQGQIFKIPEPPRREVIAHSLAEKASKQHREKRRKAFAAATASIVIKTPKKGCLTSERLSLLSPAAQKLVKTNTSIRTDKSLRESYSPSPLYNSKLTPSRFTPSSQRNSVRTPTLTPKEYSITDNLLNLSKK